MARRGEAPRRATTLRGPTEGGAARRSWATGRRFPGPASPSVVTSAGGAPPGSGHLASPLLRDICGCRARAPGGKSIRREGPEPRPSSLRAALPCLPPWGWRRPDAPCARLASGKLCPSKSSTRLTARKGAWSAARYPGSQSPARDCGGTPAPGARRAPPCASGRQDALRRPLGEPGFVGKPNFALHLHLRLCFGDLAATDLVWQKLHQEVRKV